MIFQMHIRDTPTHVALFISVLICLCVLSSVHASEQDVYWIDVRTPAEFASGHVEGAVNIEFQLIAQRIAAVTKDKDATIHLYCRSGRRSGVAKQTLHGLGYSNATNEGGIAAALISYQKRLNGKSSSE